jgi:putative transposase
MLFALICHLIGKIWHAFLAVRIIEHKPAKHFRRRPRDAQGHSQAKPEWVQQEILRLKVLMPQGTGVRKIAAAFNRIQTQRKSIQAKRTTVSKTHVANVLRRNERALLHLRQDIRSCAPGISRVNRVWGIDLTGKTDQAGQLHHILGIIDHGSRKLLSLIATSKHSAHLASHIQNAAAQHGAPRSIRTDNESCFTSPTWLASLHQSGIRHQRSDIHCPWQNGRIERLFGTLKQHLNQVPIQSAVHLQTLLDEFKHWYNSIRLHQHLAYQTPNEVWQQQKQKHSKKSAKPVAHVKPTWWTGWSGQLSGVQWQC